MEHRVKVDVIGPPCGQLGVDLLGPYERRLLDLRGREPLLPVPCRHYPVTYLHIRIVGEEVEQIDWDAEQRGHRRRGRVAKVGVGEQPIERLGNLLGRPSIQRVDPVRISQHQGAPKWLHRVAPRAPDLWVDVGIVQRRGDYPRRGPAALRGVDVRDPVYGRVAQQVEDTIRLPDGGVLLPQEVVGGLARAAAARGREVRGRSRRGELVLVLVNYPQRILVSLYRVAEHSKRHDVDGGGRRPVAAHQLYVDVGSRDVADSLVGDVEPGHGPAGDQCVRLCLDDGEDA